ncbi:PEP-CTERM sorting domain-containing protein [Planctomycetaceae bacterium SH139]
MAEVILALDVIIDRPNVVVGEEVSWHVMARLPESDATNFGIASVSFTLEDSRSEILSPATIGIDFADYFPSGGSFDGRRLIEVGALLFVQNDAVVVGADPSNVDDSSLGPFLLASGTFVATEIGEHILSTSSLDSTPSEFFTARGQLVGGGTQQFDEVRFGTGTFNVTAVPEPSSLALLAVGSFLLVRFRRR